MVQVRSWSRSAKSRSLTSSGKPKNTWVRVWDQTLIEFHIASKWRKNPSEDGDSCVITIGGDLLTAPIADDRILAENEGTAFERGLVGPSRLRVLEYPGVFCQPCGRSRNQVGA